MTPSQPKIRVALVITELEVGGAERCLVNLAVGLDRRRFLPSVFVLAPEPEPPRNALVAQLQQAEIPVHFMGFASKWRLVSAVQRLTECLRNETPHVVQSMLFHANVVTRLAVRRQMNSVWCAGIRVADPSRMRQTIESKAISAAQKVVCVSRRVSDYAQHRLKVAADRLVTIPNGVDTDAAGQCPSADLKTLGVPARKKAITCIARLTRQKGIDQLLAAAPLMLDSLPEHDLLLVGDGPEEGELRRMALRSSVGGRIHFCGWQSHVTEILRASDMLVLPSRWEGMPNVLLEAMACSLPVVCTKAEGVTEVLGPLAEQQTVEVEQPQLLAKQVVRVLGDPCLARGLGDSNRQRVADHFSLKGMLQSYEALFVSLSR